VSTAQPTIDQVVDFIYNDADAGDVERIVDAVRDSRRQARQVDRRQAMREFSIGDRVSLHGLSPKYVNGSRGTITGRANAKFVVELDDDTPQRVFARCGKSPRIPAVCLKKEG
jgi:ribosomal protein L21E